jgi:hypothetical protein
MRQYHQNPEGGKTHQVLSRRDMQKPESVFTAKQQIAGVDIN